MLKFLKVIVGIITFPVVLFFLILALLIKAIDFAYGDLINRTDE